MHERRFLFFFFFRATKVDWGITAELGTSQSLPVMQVDSSCRSPSVPY